MNEFEEICKTLRSNFNKSCAHCYYWPHLPGFTRPIGTKYFAFLKTLRNGPARASSLSKSTQQNLRWSGLVESSKGLYSITELGREYVKLAEKHAASR